MARLVARLMNLSPLQRLVLHTYEKLHRALNVLYVLFWAFVVNFDYQALFLFMFHKLAIFNDIINSKENLIVSGKLVRPVIPCRRKGEICRVIRS